MSRFNIASNSLIVKWHNLEVSIENIRGSSLSMLGLQLLPVCNIIVRYVKEKQLFAQMIPAAPGQVQAFQVKAYIDRDCLRQTYFVGAIVQAVAAVILGMLCPPAGAAAGLAAVGSLSAHFFFDFNYQLPWQLENRLENASTLHY